MGIIPSFLNLITDWLMSSIFSKIYSPSFLLLASGLILNPIFVIIPNVPSEPIIKSFKQNLKYFY